MAAINFPNSPTVGQTLIAGTITYTWDGQKWLAGVSAGATGATGVSGPTGATGAQGATGVQANLTAVTSSVIPAANVTYDLGTSSLRWRDLYLSGNSLYLGGATITATGNAIVLPQGSTIGGNVIGTGSSSVTVGNTAPASPTAGSIWFNSNTGELLVYYDDGDSFQWIQPIGSAGAATVLVSNAQPANVSIGTLWLNSDTGRLLAYYSDGVQPYWIQPVGAAGPTGATGVAGTAGTAGATGATGAGSFAFANSAPASPVVGARWLNSDSMIEYIYVNDGTSTQWVQPTNLSQTGATGATGPVAGSSGQIIYNSANVAAGSANLTFDGTTVTMSANPVLSAGTANGVMYLNGSKAATSGNTLIYDGSALTSSGGNPSAYFKIGSTAPLFAMGWADNTIYHRIKSAGGANDGIQIQLKNDAASLVLSNTPDFFFSINGSEQMRLTSTGLGIGTSSPGYKLDVAGNQESQARFTRTGTTTGASYANFKNSSGSLYIGVEDSTGTRITASGLAYAGAIGTENATALTFGTNNINRMTLDVSGNLGIGTTSPGYKLDVRGIVVSSTGTIITGLSWDTRGLVGTFSNHNLGFLVNSSVKIILDTAGNLGLGTTPSAWNVRFTALEGSYGTSIAFDNSYPNTSLTTNTYYNGTNWIYKLTGWGASLYVVSNGSHYWYNAPSGTAGNAISFTQAMTLSASGNLAIGTTQTSTGLSVWKANATTGFTIGNVNGTMNVLDNTTPSAIGVGGRIVFGATYYTGGNTMGTGYIGTYKENSPSNGGDEYNHSLVFASSNSSVGLREVGRFSSGGNLLVGTMSGYSGERQTVSYNGSAQRGIVVVDTASQNSNPMAFVYGSTLVGYIGITSSTTSYNTSSDYRLKNTIAPMTGALAKVQQLKPVTYKWNADGSDGEGFIAHELAEVCPQAVTGEKDAVDADGNPVHQGVDTSFLVATLTAAIQEQQAMIQQQQAMLNELKAEVAALKGN